MNIELHAIQSFAPSNLNRDDQGAPKDCTFGGVLRARVSSQSWKRAMRVAFRSADSPIELGVRTKLAHERISSLVASRETSASLEQIAHRVAVLLEAEPLGLSLKHGEDRGPIKTGQLLFFRPADLESLAALAIEEGDALDALPSSVKSGESKKQTKLKLPAPLAKAVKAAMTSPGRALDVALFGRLMAEMPEGNVDAACQVAHAIGTHRLASEFDFYTAVDDLRPEDTEGAGMLGTVQFNASCFYRYAVIDCDQLRDNLGPMADPAHLDAAAQDFTRAFITAVPSGKQATFAARNMPAAVLAVRRGAGAMNLANAFVTPIDAREEGGIVDGSVRRMLAEFASLERLYGARDGSTQTKLLTSSQVDTDLDRAEHIDDLIAHVSRV